MNVNCEKRKIVYFMFLISLCPFFSGCRSGVSEPSLKNRVLYHYCDKDEARGYIIKSIREHELSKYTWDETELNAYRDDYIYCELPKKKGLRLIEDTNLKDESLQSYDLQFDEELLAVVNLYERDGLEGRVTAPFECSWVQACWNNGYVYYLYYTPSGRVGLTEIVGSEYRAVIIFVRVAFTQDVILEILGRLQIGTQIEDFETYLDRVPYSSFFVHKGMRVDELLDALKNLKRYDNVPKVIKTNDVVVLRWEQFPEEDITIEFKNGVLLRFCPLHRSKEEFSEDEW